MVLFNSTLWLEPPPGPFPMRPGRRIRSLMIDMRVEEEILRGQASHSTPWDVRDILPYVDLEALMAVDDSSGDGPRAA
jgi:hypothetical protein